MVAANWATFIYCYVLKLDVLKFPISESCFVVFTCYHWNSIYNNTHIWMHIFLLFGSIQTILWKGYSNTQWTSSYLFSHRILFTHMPVRTQMGNGNSFGHCLMQSLWSLPMWLPLFWHWVWFRLTAEWIVLLISCLPVGLIFHSLILASVGGETHSHNVRQTWHS